jgi:hypothetical protein
VRVIAYPEPYSDDWSDWRTKAAAIMDAAQANPQIRFIVTFGHRPALSSGWHPGDATLLGYMNALGAAHNKYVLNLNGHSHNYERSVPQNGVTHVTVGIGGSTLEEASGSCLYAGGCPPPAWSAFRAFHHGTLRLRFTPTSIHGDAICGPAGDAGSNRNDITCTLGNPFDTFQIGADSALASEPPLEVGGLGLDRLAPNPTTTWPSLTYSLANADPVVLEVVDSAGRLVMTRNLGAPGVGRHWLSLSPGPPPRPGVYWVALHQSGATARTKLVVVR